MATWDDAHRVALALPETSERSSNDGVYQWRVRDKLFAWERPLRRADLVALGEEAPDGPSTRRTGGRHRGQGSNAGR